MRSYSPVFALVASCASLVCTIAPPKIVITPEKTVIERQIVGEYRELEEDAWLIASVKSTVRRSGERPIEIGGDEVLFRAMKIRDFNSDKILMFKDEGAVGETIEGYIAYRRTARYENDPGMKKILFQVIKDENNARKTIFNRSLVKAGIPNPDEASMKRIGLKFADQQKKRARKKHWIQDKSGTWIRKK